MTVKLPCFRNHPADAGGILNEQSAILQLQGKERGHILNIDISAFSSYCRPTLKIFQNLKLRQRKWDARCALNILVRIIMMHNRIADESKKDKRLKGRIDNIRNQIFKI